MVRLLGAAMLALAGVLVHTLVWAGAYDAPAANAATWLAQQRNADDGSWGANDADKYLQTSEAVIALGALNQQNTTYYGGVAWLGNHAPANVDFTARRVLALGSANASLGHDLQVLQSAQNLAAPGNSGWGLSGSYQGSPLDTSLTLQALNQQGVTTNVSAAVTYLITTQLPGSDSGWALGQEAGSDPVSTAQAVIALVPQKATSGVPNTITKGLAALNAKVTAASPASQIALAILANLRNDPNSAQAVSLANNLIGLQAADGSWAEDPYATALAMRALAAVAGKDLAAQKQIVNVPDNALRGAINTALGHGALDALSVGQLQQLTSLNAAGLGIADLTGLQYATHLTYLNLSNNNISSFAPVAGLTGATIVETGNPGYADASADVPTLPEWGMILMGGLLMLTILRAQRRT